MATIQEAYKGVLERGEQWRLSHWKDGQHLKNVSGIVHVHEWNDDIGYFPATNEVVSNDWERVPPPTPRPFYLMLPCEKGKGTHDFGGISGLLHVSAGAQSADYRQVPMPLTVEDVEILERLITFGHVIPLPESTNRLNRVRETLKLMQEAR